MSQAIHMVVWHSIYLWPFYNCQEGLKTRKQRRCCLELSEICCFRWNFLQNKKIVCINLNYIRQEEIIEAMKNMQAPEFQKTLRAKTEEENQSIQKKTEMLEEAQEFFGYAIQENDDRFVKFLEQKETEEKQRLKAEAKAKKVAEMKADLEELARKVAEEAAKEPLKGTAEELGSQLENKSSKVLLDEKLDALFDELFLDNSLGLSDAPPVVNREPEETESGKT